MTADHSQSAVSAPFRIKICGVRTLADIDAVAAAGADCVGLNFFAPSARFLKPGAPLVREISRFAGDAGLFRVGLFVNASADEIRKVADDLGLDAVQLHGDETPDFASSLIDQGMSVIRAVRLPTSPMQPSEFEAAMAAWSQLPVTFLLDADAGRQYGGGGKRLDWRSVQQWASQPHKRAWTLAGGLNPENIAEAIHASGARSIDVASGVELVKGQKSADLIHAFVRQANQAWAASALPD